MNHSRFNPTRRPYPSERSRPLRRPHRRPAPEAAVQTPPDHVTRSPLRVTIVLRAAQPSVDAAAASGLVGQPPLARTGSAEPFDGEPTWEDAEWQ